MTTAAICATRELSWSPSYCSGEQYDAESGLYSYKYRSYNPQLGRGNALHKITASNIRSTVVPINHNLLGSNSLAS
jgi:hypothetical protein